MDKRRLRPILATLVTCACLIFLLCGMIDPAFPDSSFTWLPQTRVNKAMKERARQVVDALLTGWREGRFEPLSDDFSLEMNMALPPADQQKAYEGLRALFGDYRSMVFVEALVSPKYPDSVMYRFKGTFSATKANPEIRVILNGDGTVTGFWVKHWQDEVR